MRALADDIFGACSNSKNVMHPTPDGSRKLAEQIRSKIREARRFYVDEEVTRTATYLGVQHPDILMSMLARARLPFKTCWVEWDNHAQVNEALGFLYSDAPKRAGALIERLDSNSPVYRLSVIGFGNSIGTSKEGVVASPLDVIYRLDRPVAGLPMLPLEANQKKIAELSRLPEEFVQMSVIGGAYMNHPKSGRDAEEVAYRKVLCDRLSSHATNIVAPWMVPLISLSKSKNIAEVLRSAVVENSGTWRFIISLFAMINTRDYVESENKFKEGKNRSVGNKVVPYLDHWLVSLKLPRKIVQRKAVRDFAEAIPRRLHEVQGHWNQSRLKGLLNCDHVYVDETPKRQVCIEDGCGHKRWWTNEFMRGDATIGIVTKDKLVEMK